MADFPLKARDEALPYHLSESHKAALRLLELLNESVWTDARTRALTGR